MRGEGREGVRKGKGGVKEEGGEGVGVRAKVDYNAQILCTLMLYTVYIYIP